MVRWDLSAADLAVALEISEATTWRRLSGQLPFTVEELGQVAPLFGLTASGLLLRAEPQKAAS